MSIRNRPSFTPLQIAGCVLWLDASDRNTFTTSGSSITQWRDKSPNGNLCTVTAGANSPQLSGSTVQARSSSSQSLSISQTFGNALVNKTLTIFFVGQRVTGSGFQYFLSGQTTASSQILQLGFFNDNMQINMYGPEYTVAIPTFSVSAEPTRIYSYSINSTTVEMVMNGTLLQSTSDTPRLTAFTGPQLGRRYTGGDQAFHNFNLNEMIAFSPTITISERRQIEGYLAQKWGISTSLPQGHPSALLTLYRAPRIIRRTPFFNSFSPIQISNCVLWLDAADSTTLTLNGSSVSQWNDKSGNNRNATQSTSSSQPLYVNSGLNNLPILNLTGRWMNLPSFTFSNITVVMIYRYNSFSGYADPIMLGNFSFFYVDNSSRIGIGRSLVTDEVLVNANTFLSTNTFAILIGTVSISGSTTSSLFFNGNVSSSLTNNSSGGSVFYTLGRNNGITNGFVSEVIVYDKILNTIERQQVESYLAQKWGIRSNLPVTHLDRTQPAGALIPIQRNILTFSLPSVPTLQSGQTTLFSATSNYQNYVVPSNTFFLYIVAWGAGGSSFNGYNGPPGVGGGGACVKGFLTVRSGETLRIIVGVGGLNDQSGTNPTDAMGGGGQGRGGGGGRTAIQRVVGTDLFVVGGGGGGGIANGDVGGAATASGTAWQGNNRSRSTAAIATDGGSGDGGGGSQTQGGSGFSSATSGTLGKGGAGVGAGAGGGGWYGGGGGFYQGGSGSTRCSGGGGSSMTSNLLSIGLELYDGSGRNPGNSSDILRINNAGYGGDLYSQGGHGLLYITPFR